MSLPQQVFIYSFRLELKKSWKFRERGILENCILFGSFADRYLRTLSPLQLQQYADILQQTDLDLFKWITGKESVPKDIDNDVMKMIRQHVADRHFQNTVSS